MQAVARLVVADGVLFYTSHSDATFSTCVARAWAASNDSSKLATIRSGATAVILHCVDFF